MSQLHKIADAIGEKRASVVFVHGLGGHHRDTWQHGQGEDAFWPTWLAADLPGIAVYSVEYDAAISRWRGAAMDLPSRGKNLLEQLLASEGLSQRRIYFVAHSLGGLVVKEMLRIAESEARHRSAAAELLAHVEKVAFLATPHTGSAQATLGDWLRVLVRPSDATIGLMRNDPSLRSLNQWYRDWVKSRSIPHLILTETQPTRILGKLVQPDSGDPGLGEHPVPLDATHSNICKPQDRTNETYVHVRNFIAREVRPHADAIVSKIDALPDEIVGKLMKELDARGQVQKAESGGLERQTIVDLARRLRPDEALDLNQAIKELESAVTIAIEAVSKGERGTNHSEFVDDVLVRIAERTKAGLFDQAAKEVDGALAQLAQHESVRREEVRLSRITLLEAGIKQDILRRDAPSVARRIEEIIALEFPDNS